jgi:hypothetical protein
VPGLFLAGQARIRFARLMTGDLLFAMLFARRRLGAGRRASVTLP